MKKIDCHIHASLLPYPANGQMTISTAEDMIAHLESLDIERAILMSGGEESFLGNEACCSIAKKFGDTFSWMCNIDMLHPETYYERLKNYKELGAVGVGELTINKRLDAELFEALFSACGRLGLPVLFHMSPEEGLGYGVVDEPGLPLLEYVLKKYPEVTFIGHSQPFWHEISAEVSADSESRNSWGEGVVVGKGRLVTLLENYTNLYCDLSANSGGCAVMRDEAFGLAFLEQFQDRLLFGTDMVNTEMIFPLGSWLDEQCAKGRLSPAAYKKIISDNAKKLFHLK